MPVIGKLLGHRKPTTTQRHTHFDDADVLATAERIGAAIEDMMGYSKARAPASPA